MPESHSLCLVQARQVPASAHTGVVAAAQSPDCFSGACGWQATQWPALVPDVLQCGVAAERVLQFWSSPAEQARQPLTSQIGILSGQLVESLLQPPLMSPSLMAPSTGAATQTPASFSHTAAG